VQNKKSIMLNLSSKKKLEEYSCGILESASSLSLYNYGISMMKCVMEN
jgi:hypothetical protein